MNFIKEFRVKPGSKVDLNAFDPSDTLGFKSKKDAAETVEKNTEALFDLQYRLYAEDKRSLLIVLQGIDAAGKDGTIRHVMSGLNPQGCRVTSFKVPSSEERDHDYLWRIHKACPRRGNIGIFNRSHYEDVLVVRVHNLVPEAQWRTRYERINEFEELLVEGGITLLKCFLHISKEEQKERLQARLDNPDKRWKFSKGDITERKLWDAYQRAYEDALTLCNTSYAPWHIVPSDRKWYRNLTVSQILRDTLKKMDPKFPPCEEGLDDVVVE